MCPNIVFVANCARSTSTKWVCLFVDCSVVKGQKASHSSDLCSRRVNTFRYHENLPNVSVCCAQTTCPKVWRFHQRWIQSNQDELANSLLMIDDDGICKINVIFHKKSSNDDFNQKKLIFVTTIQVSG